MSITFPLEKGAAIRLVHSEIASRETRARLVAAATHILGNRADAEDCVQEALILAARNAEQFEGRSSARSWLVRVVINTCRMQRRAMRRERRGGGAEHVCIDEPALAETTTDATGNPEHAAIGRDLLGVVIDELERTPARDAALFERHLVDDRPLRDLAEEARLTRQALKARLFRVRRRLAERLEAAGLAATA